MRRSKTEVINTPPAIIWRTFRLAELLAKRVATISARKLSPVRQYQLASLLILVVGMITAGWWLGEQIEQGVAHESARLNTLYVDSFVAPLLRESGGVATISPDDYDKLDTIFTTTLSPDGVYLLNVWTTAGRLIYSSDSSHRGLSFPPDQELVKARTGVPTWELGPVAFGDQRQVAVNQQRVWFGIYSPIRQAGTNQVLAVTEIYRDGTNLQEEITTAQHQTWIGIAIASLVLYLLLAGFIQRISDVVVRQESTLRSQVRRLIDVLEQNEELRIRAHHASHRIATLHERMLREIGSDLHDGPAQYLSLALLRLDLVAAHLEEHPDQWIDQHLEIVKHSLEQATGEVRALAAGLATPQIENMSPTEVILHAVNVHQRTSHTHVRLSMRDVPNDSGLAVKITLFRALQESLANAYRHGRGIDERVTVSSDHGELFIEVADGGPGFDTEKAFQSTDHMGLHGMRDRVESLGGRFSIDSAPNGHGARIRIQLPLTEMGGSGR